MRNCFLLVMVVWTMGGARPCTAAEPANLTLISPAGAAPEIFIDLRATAPEKFAAQELRLYLEKMTGRTLTIRTDYWIKGAPAGKYIAVGRNRFTASINTHGLATEQYVIDVSADRLAIVGGHDRQRGVLYGVYDLLEQLGVRWYRPEPWGEHVPKQKTIALPQGRHVARLPDYAYRSVLGGGFTRNAESTLDQQEWGSLWALRNRMNAADPGSDPRYGGQVTPSFEHTYYQTIPVQDYFDRHPDYFCLYKGKRRRVNPDAAPRPDNPTGLQLCLSNPGLQELFAQKIIGRARGRNDLAGVSFSVTPNDACPFCECAACKAMDDPNNPGSMSDRVCTFSNIVARKLSQAVPGARVSLNAYSTWTAPPTTVKRIEPNVLIHIALINEWSDYTRKFTDPESNWNRQALASIRRWQALGAANIYTYEYWSGYAWPGPLPLVRTMADRIGQYRRFNIRGIYNETSPHWGPQGLELFMFARLIWNPDLDVSRELNLYYQNYYGPAERPMKSYHEALMNAFEKSRTPVFSGGRGMHLVLTPRLMRESGAYLEQAQKLVKGVPLYERRLKGVVAGHEFAARICEIIQLRKQQGVKTPVAGSSGSYLKCPKAERAYQDVVSFMGRYRNGDAVFDIQALSPNLGYVDDDILRNGAFGYRHEQDLLTEF